MSCPTPSEYRDFILTSLISVDPCANEKIGSNILTLWNLSKGRSGCNPELQYLFTRLEVIKLLMGCYTKQVNTVRGYTEDRTKGFSESRQDGWSQQQQTSQNTSFMESIGKQRYNDLSNSRMRSKSTLLAESSSRDESHGFRNDVGNGSSVVSSWSDIEVDSTRTDRTNGLTSDSSAESNQNNGCDYQYSESETVAGSGKADASASFFIVSGEVQAGASYWQTRSVWSAKVADQSRKDGKSHLLQEDYRNMKAKKQSDETGGRSATSFFNALVDDQTHARGSDQFVSTGRGNRGSESHSSGSGSSHAKGDSESQGSSQRSSQAHSDGEAHRETSRSGFSTQDTIAYHQRFEHLRQMYDNTKSLIDHELAHFRGSQTPMFGALLLQNCDGCFELGRYARC